jgi:hypothetical protein
MLGGGSDRGLLPAVAVQPGAGVLQAFVEVVECLTGAFERPSERAGELGCGDDAGQAQERGFDGAVVAAGLYGFVCSACEQLGRGDAMSWDLTVNLCQSLALHCPAG